MLTGELEGEMDLARAWLAWQRGLQASAASPGTTKKYAVVAKLFLEYLLGRKPQYTQRLEHGYLHVVFHERVPLTALSADNARGFALWVRAEHEFTNQLTHRRKRVSINTSADYLKTLKAWAAWLTKQRVLKHNPLLGVAMPRKTEQVTPILSEQQIQAFLYQVDRGRNPLRDRAMVLLLIDLGVRAEELLQVTLEDIDWQESTVLIHGKRRKDRRLPISARTLRALREYISSPPERAGRPRTPGVTRLFLTQQGWPVEYRSLWRWMQRTGRRAGIEKVRPHMFRHTSATLHLRNGMDLFHVQQMLGHARISQTERYLRADMEALRRLQVMSSPVNTLKLGRGKREVI